MTMIRSEHDTAGTPTAGLVVLTCELPGSGKTTYAQALEDRGFVRLSIDEAIWRRIGHDAAELDPEEYEHLKVDVEDELRDELLRLMDTRLPVVVDYSFWSRERRERYKRLTKEHGCRWELVHLKASRSALLRRLRARNATMGANSVTVSEDLLSRYTATFEEPVGEGEQILVQE